MNREMRITTETLESDWWLRTEPDDPEFESLMAVSEMDDDQRKKAAEILNASPRTY